MDTNFEDRPFLRFDLVKPNNIPVVLVTIFGTIAWTAFALRIYTRGYIIKKFGWDDFAMFIAVLFYSGYSAGFVGVHKTVVGKDILTFRQWKDSLTYLLITEHFYTGTVLVLKLSLGLFLLRAIAVTWHKYVIYATMAISGLAGLGYLFFTVFQCGTFKSVVDFGTKRLLDKHCVSPAWAVGTGFAHGGITAVTDLTFAFLPIAVLRHTMMNYREKATVVFILSLGTIGSIASLVRLKFIPVLGKPSMSFYSSTLGLGSCSLIELALGIIAGCLATLRPLFRNLLRPIRAMQTRGSSPTGKLRKVRNSNEGYFAVRKASISKPYMYGNDSQARLWMGAQYYYEGPPSAASSNGEWDRATLIDGERGNAAKWEKEAFGVVSPLPRIANSRLNRKDSMRHYEMTTLPGMDRRNSYPG